MELYEAINKRRTVREFLDKDIDFEAIKRILEAGNLAPTWNHNRNWSYIILKTDEEKEYAFEYAKKIADKFDADAYLNRPKPYPTTLAQKMYAHAMPRQFTMLKDAPYVIIPVFKCKELNGEYVSRVTVIDKKLYPELQAEYCAVPDSGKCPCYNVGDEFLFYRNDERDDYWHCGAGTLVKAGEPDEGCLQSPGTAHCGSEGVPFCSEAWDAISRYIYTALQGGSIMHSWMNDDRVMIACCNDGTRPVIFKIERIDCEE